jgi:hypothetical protein
MEIKTKRILVRAVINLFKLIAYSLTVFLYTVLCITASIHYTDNPLLGLVALLFPILCYAVWDISKNQIETEIHKEERLVETIKRGY